MRGTRLNLTNFSFGTGEIANLSTNISFFYFFRANFAGTRGRKRKVREEKKGEVFFGGKKSLFQVIFPCQRLDIVCFFIRYLHTLALAVNNFPRGFHIHTRVPRNLVEDKGSVNWQIGSSL